jgi:hypothetical protein
MAQSRPLAARAYKVELDLYSRPRLASSCAHNYTNTIALHKIRKKDLRSPAVAVMNQASLLLTKQRNDDQRGFTGRGTGCNVAESAAYKRKI